MISMADMGRAAGREREERREQEKEKR